MRKVSSFFNHRVFLAMVIGLVFSTSVLAVSDKNQQVVTRNLIQKLRTDLGVENVDVKLNKVAERKLSNNEFNLSGNAVCVLTEENKQLPIQFQAKVDAVRQSVSEIKYDFVEPAVSEYAPTPNEEVLMKELMGKIRQDYKTENIVIAIDSVEVAGKSDNGNKFLGVGEVRIGDMVWSQIKFDVTLDEQTQKANKIVYKVEK